MFIFFFFVNKVDFWRGLVRFSFFVDMRVFFFELIDVKVYLGFYGFVYSIMIKDVQVRLCFSVVVGGLFFIYFFGLGLIWRRKIQGYNGRFVFGVLFDFCELVVEGVEFYIFQRKFKFKIEFTGEKCLQCGNRVICGWVFLERICGLRLRRRWGEGRREDRVEVCFRGRVEVVLDGFFCVFDCFFLCCVFWLFREFFFFRGVGSGERSCV